MNNEEKRSMKLEEKNRKFAGKNENFEKKTICSRAIPCIWASLSFTMLGRYIHSVGWRGDTLSIYAMSRPIQKEHQKAIIFMARKLQNHPCSTPTAFTPLSQVRGKYGGIRGAARRAPTSQWYSLGLRLAVAQADARPLVPPRYIRSPTPSHPHLRLGPPLYDIGASLPPVLIYPLAPPLCERRPPTHLDPHCLREG